MRIPGKERSLYSFTVAKAKKFFGGIIKKERKGKKE